MIKNVSIYFEPDPMKTVIEEDKLLLEEYAEFQKLVNECNTSNLEEAVGSMYLLGVSSIGRQDNPRRLEMLLNSSLPPSDRGRFFDNE